eukprot:15119-Amphidinium_carterae.1
MESMASRCCQDHMTSGSPPSSRGLVRLSSSPPAYGQLSSYRDILYLLWCDFPYLCCLTRCYTARVATLGLGLWHFWQLLICTDLCTARLSN